MNLTSVIMRAFLVKWLIRSVFSRMRLGRIRVTGFEDSDDALKISSDDALKISADGVVERQVKNINVVFFDGKDCDD